MEAKSKSPASLTFLLVGLVLLVTGLGLAIAFAPIADCPKCSVGILGESVIPIRKGVPSVKTYEVFGLAMYESTPEGLRHVGPLNRWSPCECCQDHHTVTLLQRIRWIEFNTPRSPAKGANP
jgi:hypothetical protein